MQLNSKCYLFYNFLRSYTYHFSRPYLFVTNNNLHFLMPPDAYVNFVASKLKLNGIDIYPTLQEVI